MARELTELQQMEQRILTDLREPLWRPFMRAIRRYRLIEPGDRIAVCVSGGKDSMLLAVLTRLLLRHSEVPFEAVFLAMDPGYSPGNRRQLEENLRRLGLDCALVESDVFEAADAAAAASRRPCFMCARMRRGCLYRHAQALGCNKIALGHHFNDVIETTVMAMLYGAQLQGMMPKLHSTNFPGMELIRPLYCVHEDDILAWKRYNRLTFLQCACRFTEAMSESGDGVGASKRQEVKQLLKTLKRDNPDVEKSVFNAIHAVCLDTFPAWKSKGVEHSFLEEYESGEWRVERVRS